ncbi:uracil-DNA glycosylase [Candidatus Marinamargulisbacteria bacterium SCGC AG-414-C22]|nr:uracil-DNA glycosylase [Candidatus Marinamargulisbacteria bacterium SCGC AG-414-C22]
MLNFNYKTEYTQDTVETLKEKIQTCTNCVLCEERTNAVFGDGPSPCDVMIIGEGPGEQEDLSGKPFVGRSGKLLTKFLEDAGINREKDVFIANIVKCRPPKNRNPTKLEIEACKPYLIRQIQLVKPKVLVLLGAPSLKTVLEEKLAITKVRGKWYKASVDYMEDDLLIMPLFHPSYLLRNASNKEGGARWLTALDISKLNLRRSATK